jgi:hypothetical protein
LRKLTCLSVSLISFGAFGADCQAANHRQLSSAKPSFGSSPSPGNMEANAETVPERLFWVKFGY